MGREVSDGGEEGAPDIQLTGVGIQQEHCCFEIINNDLFIIPSPGARSVVKSINKLVI